MIERSKFLFLAIAPWTTTPSMIVDEKLQLYLTQTKARLQDVEGKLATTNHKKRKVEVFVVKAKDQLQDYNHLVSIAQATMVAIEKELKHVFKMQKKINAHKIILGLVSSLLKTTNSMIEKVARDSKMAGSSLYALKENFVAYRCHHSTTKAHVCRIEKGPFKGPCVSMPLNFVDDYDTSLPTYLWVEKCPFSGLALEALWGGKFTFCKHVYHD